MDERELLILYYTDLDLNSYKIVIWVGINDCGMRFNPIRQLSGLFTLHDQLYNVGARNFVYFNVPPTDRSPAGVLAFIKSEYRK